MFKQFISCEAKFFGLLMIWLLVMNIISFLLKNILQTAPLISIFISIIVICIYLCYFIYKFINVVVFKKEYECKNIYHRVSGCK